MPEEASLFPRGVPRTYDMPQVTVDRLLDDAVQDVPDLPALIHRGRRLSWRQVQDQVDRLGAVLEELDVTPGSHVPVALARTPQALIALFAIWRVGAVAVVIDADASADVIARAQDEFNAAVVLVEDRRCATVTNRLPDSARVLTTGPEDAWPFPRNLAASIRRRLRHGLGSADRLMDLMRRHAPLTTRASHMLNPADAAAVFTVGGDAQIYSHQQLLAAAFQLRLWIPDMTVGSERIMSTLPIHVPVGLTAAITMPALAAATTILVRAQEARRFARAVERHDPTVVVTGYQPSPEAMLRGESPALRACLQAGVPDQGVVERIEERTGGRVRGWWCPPTSAGIVLAEPVYGLTKPGTVGVAVTNTHAAVRDTGTLWLKGPQLTGTGWVSAELTAAIDEDGYVTLTTQR